MNNNNEVNDVGVDDTYGENLVKYAVKNFQAYLPGKARQGIQKYYCEYHPWGIENGRWGGGHIVPPITNAIFFTFPHDKHTNANFW